MFNLRTRQTSRPVAASLASKTGWSAAAGGCTIINRVATSIVIARLLGVEGAGQVAYLIWIVTTAVTVLDVGVTSSVSRYVAELDGRGDSSQAGALARRLMLTLLAIVGIGVIGLSGVSEFVFNSPRSGSEWALLGGLIAAQSFGAFYRAYLGGRHRFRDLAALAIPCTILQQTGLVLGVIWFGVYGAILGYLFGAVVPAVLSLRILRASSVRETVQPDLKQRVTRNALYVWGAAIVSMFVWSRTEIFFLGRFVGADAVAMFAVGLAMATIAVQGPLLLVGPLLPHFSKQSTDDDQTPLRETYATGTRLMALLVFPACFGLVGITPVILPLIYGEAFSGAIPTAMILIAGGAFAATASVGSSLVYALERARFICITGLIGAMLAVIAGFLIIPLTGAVGAATCRIILQLTFIVIGTVYIARSLECPAPLRALFAIIASATMCGAAAYTCTIWIDSPMSVCVSIPAGAATYLAALRLTRAVPARDIELLRSTARWAPRWAQGSINWLRPAKEAFA